MASHRGRYRMVAGCTDTLPWAREGRAGDVDIPVLIDVSRKFPSSTSGSVDERRVRLGAATPIQRFLDDAALGARAAVDAALRGLVCRRPNSRAGDRRRQYRQCLAGRRRDALPDRAGGRRSSWPRRGGKSRHACRSTDFVTGPSKTALARGRIAHGRRMRRAAGLRRQLREGRPPPLAGDLAGLPRRPDQARCARPRRSKMCGWRSAASGRGRCA